MQRFSITSKLDQSVIDDSYKGTSLQQAGALCSCQPFTYSLILVGKAEAYPCGTFQIRLRCNRLTITKASSLLHAKFVAIRHLQPSLIFNIRLECSTRVCSSLVHKN